MLPDELLAQLNEKFQCREQQLHHLAALYTVCVHSVYNSSTCITSLGASPISTLPQCSWPSSDRENVAPTLLLPFVGPIAYNH
jgi:hypothetical protein